MVLNSTDRISIQMKQVMRDLTQNPPTNIDTLNRQDALALTRQIVSLSEELQRSRDQAEELRAQLSQAQDVANEKHNVR
jgi:hypothetical protein